MTILFFLCQYTEDEQLDTSRSSPTRKTFFPNIERKTIRKQKKWTFLHSSKIKFSNYLNDDDNDLNRFILTNQSTKTQNIEQIGK